LENNREPAIRDFRTTRTPVHPAAEPARHRRINHQHHRKHDIRWAFLTARGTSNNAGRYANYLWGAQNGLPPETGHALLSLA
jgi:hypothetical protein